MTALSKVTNELYTRGPFVTHAWKVANGVTIAETSVFIGLASTGYAGPFSLSTYNLYLGVLEPSGRFPLPILGDTTKRIPPEVVVTDDPVELLNVPVTGVASITDTLAPVYLTDGQTLTLTKGSNVAVGYVRKFISAAVADVRLYSAAEVRLKAVQA